MDLFSTSPEPPLAERLRPASLDEVVGQAHLLGPGKPLRLAFDAKRLHSFVLMGPPGIGKTTIARLAAKATDGEFIALSAVQAGVKEIRDVAARAQTLLDMRQQRTICFIDEIHRLSKSQQDVLLPYMESGLLTVCGATTEQVSLELNAAVLSRMTVYQLQSLTDDDVEALHERAAGVIDALPYERGVLRQLALLADGDGRKLLNAIDQVDIAAKAAKLPTVSLEFLKSTMGQVLRRFDKSGSELYEQISAFQKSIRGSSPNAALYWLARMLDGGADARYIARRLVVIASEDIGNADPQALQLALNSAEAYERLGSPEGDRALAQASVYLALAPKSNAVYAAWNQARALVASEGTRPVPMHLRNAPTELMAEMGYKKGYRYAHAEPGGYAAGETYFPDGMADPRWYQPVPRGREVALGERLTELRQLDSAAWEKDI